MFASNNFIGGELSQNLTGITKNGERVSTISIAAGDIEPLNNNEKVLASYYIGPSGAIIENSATLTMHYYKLEIPSGWYESDLKVVQTTNSSGWRELRGDINTALQTVSVRISELGSYAIIATKPPPLPRFPWLGIGLITSFWILLTVKVIFYKNKRSGLQP